MASIYNVLNWDSTGGTNYQINDIVKDTNGVFWYATKANNSTTTPAVGSTDWGGNITITIDGTSTTQPYFLWSPSFNMSTAHQPRVKSIKFGDGYEQRIKDGINNKALNVRLSFESRNEEEAKAILHFLHARESWEPFYFKVPAPYSITKKFVCKSFNNQFIFADNYTIQCELTEVS
jgi:phage-related protein